jgi:hypothetical protein
MNVFGCHCRRCGRLIADNEEKFTLDPKSVPDYPRLMIEARSVLICVRCHLSVGAFKVPARSPSHAVTA